MKKIVLLTLLSLVLYVNTYAFRSGAGIGNQGLFYRAIWSDSIKSQTGMNIEFIKVGFAEDGLTISLQYVHWFYLMPFIYTFYENDTLAFNTGMYLTFSSAAIFMPEIEIKPFENKDIRLLSVLGKIEWDYYDNTVSLVTIFNDFNVKVCWYF